MADGGGGDLDGDDDPPNIIGYPVVTVSSAGTANCAVPARAARARPRRTPSPNATRARRKTDGQTERRSRSPPVPLRWGPFVVYRWAEPRIGSDRIGSARKRGTKRKALVRLRPSELIRILAVHWLAARVIDTWRPRPPRTARSPQPRPSRSMLCGRNLKEWLQEQFCDKPLEQCEDMRLHNAAYVGDLDTLRSLLLDDTFQRRINEKSVWCCGWLPCTPLRIAATAGHSECVRFLIGQGAEVDLVDVKGQTALYVAVVNGHLDCVRILLEAGADPNGSRHHRSTPVYHAARVGRVDILRELIRYHADVDVDHQLGPRPLFSARTLSTLVVCPLYISAAYHHLPCFRLLLQAGANPDYNYSGPVSREALGRGLASCLLDAALRHGCHADFVALLLDHGADPYLVPWAEPDQDGAGRTKVDPEALRLFQQARMCPQRLTHLCRVCLRRALGKRRLGAIPSLPLPDALKLFLLHEDC